MTAHKEIPLANQELLRVGMQGGLVAVAYYRPRRLDEHGPPIRRFACKKTTLEHALWAVFEEGEAPHSTDATVLYVRATEWGKDLP